MTDPIRRRLTASIRADGGPYEARLAYLETLLFQQRSFSRLAMGLPSRIPLVRQEAAAALATFGTEEALEILRTCETHEAQTVLGLLHGLEPLSVPEPQPELIEWRGQQKPVYRLSDVMAAQTNELTAAAFLAFTSDYADLHTLWTAH